MPEDRKQRLLRRHRRDKRFLFATLVCALAGLGAWVGFAWILPLLVLFWVAHEAWFSDHLFYAPDVDYAYRFGAEAETLPVTLANGRLALVDGALLHADDTLLLAVTVRSAWTGRFFDPAVMIVADACDVDGNCLSHPQSPSRDIQTFERGARGVRYLNLTGLAAALQTNGLRLAGWHCRLEGAPRLLRVRHPDYRRKRLLVVAPHADDAELAAFGLYTQAREAWIVTLTAGEVEAEHYRRMGFDPVGASRLKGRLRAWDSVAVPLWAGVPVERAIQLGYFCLQLPVMRARPAEAICSREAGMCDTRPFRRFNRFRLASDENGIPSWNSLVADLREIILTAKPEVIVLPHPLFDPHPDHVAAVAAVREALAGSAWRPETLLHYANHLHDNDRWPMGEAHAGVALPPLVENSAPLLPWVLPLGRDIQTDKAMALAMMHDLITPLSRKKRLRRLLQRWLAGRRHPPCGAHEFFRKAVRRHELFWVESCENPVSGRARNQDNP
ncbi:MAG: PIG-L family deacetylase [Zoogloeaceae bacterium]|jgi:LmbE family N-acetylglucosaminyl deacetylase|nr:PIG-L family deacetylase [Zoogloeaceae bacterium]